MTLRLTALLLPLLCVALSSWTHAADGAASPPASLHAPWSALLATCVEEREASTAVDYHCFQQRHAALAAYLDALGEVTPEDYRHWPRARQLAFLINAYNAWTVELILSRYPDLESIRDLGNLLRSPWKKTFIPLLGDTVSLDDIEHGLIRQPGIFDEPRIHFAVNCASVGCPALRREAYEAAQLEAQLESQTRAFLEDRSRNGLREGELALSPLFDWYRGDFERPWRGSEGLHAFLLRYADALDLPAPARQALADEQLPIRFLDYDWALNDLR